MSGGDIRTVRQARQALGLGETASVEDLRRAFRAGVRAAHPDRGGDPVQLRRVVDAYRLLTALHDTRLKMALARVEPEAARPPAPTTVKPDGKLPLEITVAQAMGGGAADVTLPDGRRGRLKLPAGLRAKDVVRLTTPDGPILFTVRFAMGEMEVRGDSVWMTATAPASVLAKGGRVEAVTAAGPRSVWLTPESGKRGLVRIPGAGLPARGAHKAGHLFIRLKAEAAAPEAGARGLLRRFTAAWAA